MAFSSNMFMGTAGRSNAPKTSTGASKNLKHALDTLPASAELLPAVAAALEARGSSMAVLVDGGIRRGTDIFKALALGADAVLLGRPCINGLVHAGAHGAAHVLRLLRDEFEMTLALCGCRTVHDISRDHLTALHRTGAQP